MKPLLLVLFEQCMSRIAENGSVRPASRYAARFLPALA